MHGTAILDCKVIDFPDVKEHVTGPMAPGARNFLASGYRAITIMPMIRGKTAIGAISVVRVAPGPLSEKQRELLKTFAAQAVIAIENTRLLNELRQRTDDLSESLEQQTATSEVLKVISSSPGELEPVFDAMLANATRICEANFGVMFGFEDGKFRGVSSVGIPPEFADFVRQARVWGTRNRSWSTSSHEANRACHRRPCGCRFCRTELKGRNRNGRDAHIRDSAFTQRR